MEEKETEFRYKYMSIPLPLTLESIFECTDIYLEKDASGKLRNITKDEKSWLTFLCKKSEEYYKKNVEMYNGILEIYNRHIEKGKTDELLEIALSVYQERIACAILLITRCREIVKDNNIVNIKHTLAQNKARITELESQLKEALRRTDEAEQQASNTKEQSTSCRDGHGLCSIVLQMRGEGKKDEEIAKHLKTSGVSIPQIGALLHANPYVSNSARVKYVQRLLGVS
ncbi:hypothetical protein [Bilophila wadsworthia]|uniref:hypothetical protein n=1 Tax=Bilophila wadsworthia TaxID=35833 RepID=UPI002A81DFC5|nr:hypothetical protein [Bilophila wadsworthia]MDY3682848.1 hypothetical protein [Bilophila wadsworthia]